MSAPSPVVIVAYDMAWPAAFDGLRRVLAHTFGGVALAIEHVGSTAVPGLAAKPIIDMDVVVESDAALPDAVRLLGGLGYFHEGDLGLPGREAFDYAGDDVPRDGTGRVWPAHHLYVCPRDSAELARHLALRTYLRANPDAARDYGALKRELARRFGSDRDGYSRAKSEFIGNMLRKATAQ